MSAVIDVDDPFDAMATDLIDLMASVAGIAISRGQRLVVDYDSVVHLSVYRLVNSEKEELW